MGMRCFVLALTSYGIGTEREQSKWGLRGESKQRELQNLELGNASRNAIAGDRRNPIDQ